MWSNIILNGGSKNSYEEDESSSSSSSKNHPPTRYKHSCILVPIYSSASTNNGTSTSTSTAASTSSGQTNYDLYLYGGRSGTFPLKDFWKLDLKSGKWEEIQQDKDKQDEDDDCWPPHLQEHSMVYYERKIYVFGGEISFSYGEDLAPLWIYSMDTRKWRRWGLQNPDNNPQDKTSKFLKQIKSPDLSRQTKTPLGRRGHSAVVWNNYMLIYGGYRDLKGSLGELWAFHFDTESWHLFSSHELNKKNARPWYFFPSQGSCSSQNLPCPRHSQTSVLHNNILYIHGGMQDLLELQDFWKFCLKTRKWTNIKAKYGPGPLHGHTGVCALDSLLIMSGERAGKAVDEFWRFDFLSEQWEKVVLNGCRPCPRIWAWGGMLPMVLKRVEGSYTSSGHYRRFPGQFDDLEVCSTSTEADDGNKYWWDYDEAQDGGGGSSGHNGPSRPTNGNGNGNNGNVQIQVTSSSDPPDYQTAAAYKRKSSLFSDLARFPFSTGGDYQALSESNSVCLSEEETSPRQIGGRNKWIDNENDADKILRFEPITAQMHGVSPNEAVNLNVIQEQRNNFIGSAPMLIDLGEDPNANQNCPKETEEVEADTCQVVLEGPNSLITFETTNNGNSTKTTTAYPSAEVGTRPLSASNSTRRSESANCLQLNQRTSKQSVKKSASVRFADIDENDRQVDHGNGGGGGYSRSSSQHQLILRECTSDYSSMDNGLNYSQHKQQQQQQAQNGNNGIGFENPNYRGSGSSTLFGGGAPGVENQGKNGMQRNLEVYEMGTLNPESQGHPDLLASTSIQKPSSSNSNPPGNGVHFDPSTTKPQTGIEEDSPTPYYYEVSTPNYMLLIGGNESHSSQVVCKRQPLSIWRLRVTPELFSAPTNSNGSALTSPTQGNYPSSSNSGSNSRSGGGGGYSNSVLSNSNSINRSMMQVDLSGPNHNLTTGF